MFKITSLLLLLGVLGEFYGADAAKVVCYWNGKSFWREGVAKVTAEDLKPGLSYCTHLYYGFAGIDDDDYHVEPLDKKLDLDKGKAQYRAVVGLKRSQPGLQVYLSVGGLEDTDDPEKYFEVLEKPERRTIFVNSMVALLKEFQFDGVDLAWQFPQKNEKYESYTFASIWHKFKKTLGFGVDSKATEHRDQFTALLREMKAALRAHGYSLSIGVLPHVNASVYYDIRTLMPFVDMVTLFTSDLRTPERSPKLADYSAPLYFQYGRLEHQNVDYLVKYWLEHGADPAKLIVGIPTYGRSWKTTTDSSISGVPPLVADGPGNKGPHTKTEGLLAYYETCTRLVSPTNPKAPASMLRRITDPSHRLGTYAYRLPDKTKGEKEGMWVSFEEPETAADKANFVKAKGLGGAALLDIALDDPKGMCDGTKFPILRAVKLNL
uniref:Venom chitinase n=1 Tax=Lethocerus distinctifemur TaxID=280095 RepID=A0A2K8JLB2_9HEMI|nr:venom chitinase [Lethocerus distinctifemur]